MKKKIETKAKIHDIHVIFGQCFSFVFFVSTEYGLTLIQAAAAIISSQDFYGAEKKYLNFNNNNKVNILCGFIDAQQL